MKAITYNQYGSADVLQLRDMPVPTPTDHDVLIEVRSAGVDRSVVHLMTGRPLLVRLVSGVRSPRQQTLGADVAGTVVAVGPSVTRFSVGDAVCGTARGSYAPFALAHENKVVTKPDALDFSQAASLPISGCAALHAVRLARLIPGQRVLVLGAAGGVGSFAIQLAKAAGAYVTGVASTAKQPFVSELGADESLDYTRDHSTSGDNRYDAIIDIGGNRSNRALRRVLTDRGSLVIVGGEGAGGPLLGGADRQLRASLQSPFIRQRLVGVVSSEGTPELDALAAHVVAGELTPAIDRTFPLENAADAIRYLVDGNVRGKVAITVA